jgi:hypothetical protein
MIGRGFGAVRNPGPTDGRRPRNTTNSASGRIRTRRKRPCPGRRDTRVTCACGQASASERRLATDGACADPRRSVSRSRWVRVAGRSRPNSAARLVPPRLTRTRPCEARTCGRCTPIGLDSPATTAQLGFWFATRVSVKTRVTQSIPSSAASGAAGAGSMVGVASTAAGTGGSPTTGTSAEAVGSNAPDSAAGAGAGVSSAMPGMAFGSSSADIPAVGSSS